MPAFLAGELRPSGARCDFHAIGGAAFSAFGFDPRVTLFDRDGLLLHRLAHQPLQVGSIRFF